MPEIENRKLLVSVFNAQEAREAVLGGGRIIDSEDPRSALGNIKPRNIMDISSAVLNYRRNDEVQLSTNIGEDQLLFDRSELGRAIEKSPYEIAGKAAQAAIGVALAMDTEVHPVNIVKVGVDGMEVGLAKQVLEEVVLTLKHTEKYRETQVMAVLFVQDLDLWDERKKEEPVIKTLVRLREFFLAEEGDDEAFDLTNYAVGTFMDKSGKPLFTNKNQVGLKALKDKDVLPQGAKSTMVRLNELFPHKNFGLSTEPTSRRTNQETIRMMVDATAEAGADCIMLDTRIQTKASRISLVKLDESEELVDIASFDYGSSNLARKGVLKLDEIRFFVEYCHYRGIEANLAGSLQSYMAQQLWSLVPNTDQMSTRGGSSVVRRNPDTGEDETDSRQSRETHRNLVLGLVPPEQGGCFNLPDKMKGDKNAAASIRVLFEKYRDHLFYWVDKYGAQTEISKEDL